MVYLIALAALTFVGYLAYDIINERFQLQTRRVDLRAGRRWRSQFRGTDRD